MNAAVGALSERGIFLPEAEEEAALASWSIHWIPRIPELLQCWKTQCTSRLSFLCDLIGKEFASDWLHALLSGPYDEAFWQQQRSIAHRLAQQSAQLLRDRDLLRLFTSLRQVFLGSRGRILSATSTLLGSPGGLPLCDCPDPCRRTAACLHIIDA